MKNNIKNKFFHFLSSGRYGACGVDLGIYIGRDILWVYCQPFSQEQDKSHSVNSFAVEDGDWKKALALVAKKYPQARVQLLLANEHYKLIVTDKPSGPQENLPTSLLLAVKTLVTQPITDIHLDYFESPLANNPKVTVVVTDKPWMSTIIKAVNDSGMTVLGVTIEELGVSNLYPEDAKARLLVCQYGGQELLLAAVKQGELLMQRRIRGFGKLGTTPIEALNNINQANNSLVNNSLVNNNGLIDKLSLEIQRSIDYFESQLRQAPVASIELLVEGHGDPLAALLGANLDLEVNTMDIAFMKKAPMANAAVVDSSVAPSVIAPSVIAPSVIERDSVQACLAMLAHKELLRRVP